MKNDYELGENVFRELTDTHNLHPARPQWQQEFLRQTKSKFIPQAELEKIWEHSNEKGRIFKPTPVTETEKRERATAKLRWGETILTVFLAFGLGLLGALFQWLHAYQLKQEGYFFKAQKTWRIYWLAFLARIVLIIIFAVVVIALNFLSK